jgi:hypothetical protein
MGAAILKIQLPTTKSPSTGDTQNAAANSISRNKPTHFDERRVFRLARGSPPHTPHRQCFQNPTGKIGIQKMCPTSKVRVATDRHAARQIMQ